MATRKKITDPTNNRRKMIMYGVCSLPDNGGMPTIAHLRNTRAEAVKAASILGLGICKVEMLVPSEKNQWTITVDECIEVTPSSMGWKNMKLTEKEKVEGKALQHVRTCKFTLETVNRPIVWGTKRLTDEAVQAYIEAYIGDNPKEIANFTECNGTTNLFSNPRSPQIN